MKFARVLLAFLYRKRYNRLSIYSVFAYSFTVKGEFYVNTEKKTRLAVFFGGESSEYEISCISAAGVLANLDRERYTVLPVGITREGLWFLYTGDSEKIRDGSWCTDAEHLVPAVLSPCKAHRALMTLNKEKKTYDLVPLDCIFPVMHGENCEDGKLQGLLEYSGVPYIGCATRASAVTMDKVATKLMLSSYGIPQAKWTVSYRRVLQKSFSEEICRIEKALPYPLFVKPAGTGSSRGVSRAADREELSAALKCAMEFDEKILIEEEVHGTEVEVAVLEKVKEDGTLTVIASTPGEIVPDGSFYDYDAKYVKGTSVCRAPAEISEHSAARVRSLALRIFSALECAGLSRVDFFVDGETVIFNEINTLPGFTPISMYPKLFEFDQLPYSALLDALVERALKGERR